MEKDIVENIFRNINNELSAEDIVMLSPLQLAYIGDAVYELLVRSYILDRDKSVNDLHLEATKYARAESQAEIVFLLEDFFTDKEHQLIRRGRNTKTNSSPKNASIMDYKYATGFEAMLGYLYLKKEFSRIEEIFNEINRVLKEKEDVQE